MPKGVRQAIIGVWITIGLSVIGVLINKWTNAISTGEFVFYTSLYAIFCIFPYKLGKGSNPTRWVYAILTVTSILFMLGGVATEMRQIDLIISAISLPIEIYIIFQLFQREATQWFSQATL